MNAQHITAVVEKWFSVYVLSWSNAQQFLIIILTLFLARLVPPAFPV